MSGTLSKRQIAIDLGEDSRDDESDDTETETKDVDITNCTGDFNWIYKAANQAAFN